MAYVTYPDGILWRSRVDGSQKLQLTSTVPLSAYLPHWSPDSKQICFSGYNPNQGGTLYVISADGGTPRSLSVAKKNVHGATWMPDGNAMSFYDTEDVGDSEGVVSTVDLKTLQVKILTKAAGLAYPVTSPDGHSIAAPASDGQKLMLFDFSSRKWSELLKMDVGWTTWSADSKYIYFDTGSARALHFTECGSPIASWKN